LGKLWAVGEATVSCCDSYHFEAYPWNGKPHQVSDRGKSTILRCNSAYWWVLANIAIWKVQLQRQTSFVNSRARLGHEHIMPVSMFQLVPPQC
jgi:hypothetical protein